MTGRAPHTCRHLRGEHSRRAAHREALREGWAWGRRNELQLKWPEMELATEKTSERETGQGVGLRRVGEESGFFSNCNGKQTEGFKHGTSAIWLMFLKRCIQLLGGEWVSWSRTVYFYGSAGGRQSRLKSGMAVLEAWEMRKWETESAWDRAEQKKGSQDGPVFFWFQNLDQWQCQ